MSPTKVCHNCCCEQTLLCKLQEGGVYQEAIASIGLLKRQGYNVTKRLLHSGVGRTVNIGTTVTAVNPTVISAF